MITNIAIHIILNFVLFILIFKYFYIKNLFSIYLNSKYFIMYKYLYTLLLNL